jgi:GT2 family glycosyltransferase
MTALGVPVTVVIPSYDEGHRLAATVESLLATLPAGAEVIVVDDCSTDGSADRLGSIDYRVRVLRPPERLGVAGARNYGASVSHGSLLVFCDAHVSVSAGWLRPLADALAVADVGAVSPGITSMDAGATGYGLTWVGRPLHAEWLGRFASTPYAVPFLGGGFLALRRDVFFRSGAFDPGFMRWGSEDIELSLRLWLLGWECRVVPAVEVVHDFRTSFPYAVRDELIVHNQLRLGVLHFGQPRLAALVSILAEDAHFAAAASRLFASDVLARRMEIEQSRRYDDGWFTEAFGLPFDRVAEQA